jgi:hypothetical protein
MVKQAAKVNNFRSHIDSISNLYKMLCPYSK